jgi:hypothetical protein
MVQECMSRKNTKKKLRIFDDKASIFHAISGLIYSYLHITYYPLSFLILILFISYETIESRTKRELLCDIIEFSIGVIIGYILLIYFGAYASINY